MDSGVGHADAWFVSFDALSEQSPGRRSLGGVSTA
jgi:hypothetical protein